MAASVEQKKQQYSKQLAEYTLRQWNTVRHESGSQRKDNKQPTTPSNGERDRRGDENENTTTDRNSDQNGQTTPTSKQRTNGRKGVQIVDFGSRRSPKRPA